MEDRHNQDFNTGVMKVAREIAHRKDKPIDLGSFFELVNATPTKDYGFAVESVQSELALEHSLMLATEDNQVFEIKEASDTWKEQMMSFETE